MAETAESVSSTETKKVINPRVEIDTSAPFESVKEAVDRFGGSGPWIPLHLLRFAAARNENDAFDVEKLEKDLVLKERETLNVMRELEATRRFIEDFRVNLMAEMSSIATTPDSKVESHVTIPIANSTEEQLNRAKVNLSKTSVDLALIQASVESLNMKLRNDTIRTNMHARKPDLHGFDIPRTLSYETMMESSRYEVTKAMMEIERTKNSIKMAEMRLNAAKKMEEAAKAVEAIALVERNDLPKGENSSYIFDEYRMLAQVDELWKTKFIDTNGLHRGSQFEMPILEKFEQSPNGNEDDYFDKEGYRGNVAVESGGVRWSRCNSTKSRSTTSIGDVLSKKYVIQDDVAVGTRIEDHSERQHVSLSQMMRKQRWNILNPSKSKAIGNIEKQTAVERKRSGFIQMPISIKQSKKKGQQ